MPSEQEVAAAGAEPGLARALELIRLGIRVEGVREWLFTIRSFDDQQLIAAAELARRAGAYDRAIHTADRTSRVHNYALRYPVPYHDVFREYAKSHGVDEAWVLGLGAPGEPLQRRRALERRRRRPDAGNAGHRALCRRAPRPAQLPAEERDRHRDQRHARHRLPEARHGPARSPGARLGGVQRRPVARAPLARRRAARRRDLRRVDPVLRDARLREEGDGELGVVRRGARPEAGAAQGAARRDPAAGRASSRHDRGRASE